MKKCLLMMFAIMVLLWATPAFADTDSVELEIENLESFYARLVERGMVRGSLSMPPRQPKDIGNNTYETLYPFADYLYVTVTEIIGQYKDYQLWVIQSGLPRGIGYNDVYALFLTECTALNAQQAQGLIQRLRDTFYNDDYDALYSMIEMDGFTAILAGNPDGSDEAFTITQYE